jgi:mRNA interferase RelE/StbE
VKDLDALDRPTARRVLEKIRGLENNPAGDVKRLTNFTPEYRLRVGDCRSMLQFVQSTAFRLPQAKAWTLNWPQAKAWTLN